MAKDRAKAAQDAGFDIEDLEWISSLRHDINDHQETAREKFVRKLKSNPLVPIGETGHRRMSTEKWRRGWLNLLCYVTSIEVNIPI